RRLPAAALPGVDAVPLGVGLDRQGAAEGAGPLRDLPADSRHLHAVHPDRPARALGLGAVRGDLGAGDRRRGVQAVLHRTIPAAVDPAVHRDGLAGAGGDQAAAGRARWLDTRLAAGRWRLLHAGNILLPPAVAALF